MGRADTSSWIAVLYHHVTDEVTYRADSPFTHGLGADLPVRRLAEQLDALQRRYAVVDLATASSATPSGRKPLVITFDDAYASAARLAAPLLARRGLPWVFFVNPALLDNRTLAFDNFVAYVFNVYGAAPLQQSLGARVGGIAELIATHAARMRPETRQRFMDDVTRRLGLDVERLAGEAQLYLSTAELQALVSGGVEIGNHTSDHVHCRSLTGPEAAVQIGGSAARLRQLTGAPVRAFAYPYGAEEDATPVARQEIRRAGHDLAFLVQARQNSSASRRETLYRVAPRSSGSVGLYVELELMPRLRTGRRGVARRPRACG